MEIALAVVRFAHFAATMFVFGASVFLSTFAPPRLSAAIAPRLRPALIGASLASLASALVWPVLEAAAMSGDWAAALDPETLGEVLTSTAFGAVWLWRMPLLAALVGIVILGPARRPGWTAIVAGLALASLALVDHAAMQSGGIGIAHRANDAIHLLTTGGWLGGLPPFALALAAARRAELAGPASEAMLRFSAVGQLAVVVILATGAINIGLTSGHFPWPPNSPYRMLLIAKIAVVAAMVAMAIFNRYALLPRIERDPKRARTLGALASLELVLALTAVALVSYFGLLDPG